MKYEHTQIGTLIIIVSILVAILFAVIVLQTGFILSIFIAMLVILFIVASFSSLHVAIDEKYLRIKFGYGIFRKKFLLKEITSVKSVKNKWYYGWGIRLWLWPKIWIFNISGFDAVEIKMKNGASYRIGTDESEKLKKAILIALK